MHPGCKLSCTIKHPQYIAWAAFWTCKVGNWASAERLPSGPQLACLMICHLCVQKLHAALQCFVLNICETIGDRSTCSSFSLSQVVQKACGFWQHFQGNWLSLLLSFAASWQVEDANLLRKFAGPAIITILLPFTVLPRYYSIQLPENNLAIKILHVLLAITLHLLYSSDLQRLANRSYHTSLSLECFLADAFSLWPWCLLLSDLFLTCKAACKQL